MTYLADAWNSWYALKKSSGPYASMISKGGNSEKPQYLHLPKDNVISRIIVMAMKFWVDECNYAQVRSF